MVRKSTLAARIFTVGIAVAAITWAFVTIPKYRAEARVAQVAKHIIAGEKFKPDFVAALADQSSRGRLTLRPAALRDAAIIQLRAAEDAVRLGDRDAINTSLKSLGVAIDAALMRAPNDSFLWLSRFWVTNTQRGFVPDSADDLRMSYALGANEGWIAIKRNRLVMGYFSLLPPDLAEAVTLEFVSLVRSQFYDEASDIIAGPAWPFRYRLLERLQGLDERQRRLFAKLLYDKNLNDVPVPGVDPRPNRPWK